ncbi:hypothetical protein SBRY_10199 [Actinacidiphila bryophytorum]|uniref:Uncharacterized protein n=1 Tax=Actinacidiphila bryophytorum TaxID=1436133 RepID=A0A9W4GYG1_9ACTN|nr:hypothetical protein SBRY_10199 [Actinacidiphila bryophytorum]
MDRRLTEESAMLRAIPWQRLALTALTLASVAVLLSTLGAPEMTGG